MRFKAAISGDLTKVVSAEWRVAGKAIRRGLREEAKALHAEIRLDAERHGLKRLAKVWKMRVYGGKRGPWESAALIYPKGGERTRAALDAFDKGAIIRPKKGRYLLIPTSFNMTKGRRGGRVKYQPHELQGTFVRKSRGGNLLLFARVAHAQQQYKGGVRDQAYVNSTKLGSGRKKRTKQILEAGAVPMFQLVPQVKIQKRTSRAALVRRSQSRVGRTILRHWKGD